MHFENGPRGVPASKNRARTLAVLTVFAGKKSPSVEGANMFVLCLVLPAFGAEEPLLTAIDLPLIAEHLRDHGVDDTQVRDVLVAARAGRLSASEVAESLTVTDAEVVAHGPLPELGAFFVAQLDLGLRGPELDEAIRLEHSLHGTGAEGPPPCPKPRAARRAQPPPDPKAEKKAARQLKRDQRAQDRLDKRNAEDEGGSP